MLYEVTNEGGYKDWDRFVVETVHAYEKTKPKQHPVGLTGHGSENNDEMLASPADWFSPGSSQWPDLKADPRAVDGKKVSLLDTDHVFGVGGDQKWVWKAFLRGHNVLFMDPYDDPAWAPVLAGQGVGVRDAEACRRAMGHARRYAERIDLAASRPAGELASTGYCLAVPGREYLVYLPDGGAATVDLSAAQGQALRGVDAPDHGQDHPRRGGGWRRETHAEGALRRRRRALPADHALTETTPLPRPSPRRGHRMRARLPIGLAALVLRPRDSPAFALQPRPGRARYQEPFTPRTRVSLRGARWCINDELTNRGTRAEGLLMNVRMVNAVFEDRRKPDLDPAAITDRFLAHAARLRRARRQRLHALSPGRHARLRGGAELGVRAGWLPARVVPGPRRAVSSRHATGRGWSSSSAASTSGRTRSSPTRPPCVPRWSTWRSWIKDRGFRNVVLEIANEFDHGGFDHRLIRTVEGEVELIRLAKKTAPGLLVSTSGLGHGRYPDALAEAADFLLIHFNGTPLDDIPARIEALKRFGKPIVCNEDPKTGEAGARAAELCVANGASWGFMAEKLNQHLPVHVRRREGRPRRLREAEGADLAADEARAVGQDVLPAARIRRAAGGSWTTRMPSAAWPAWTRTS